MNAIIYSPDGSGMNDQMFRCDYNFLRSHGYAMFYIANEIGCLNVYDGNPNQFQHIVKGSDLYYILKAFPQYTFTQANVNDYADAISFIPTIHVDHNQEKLIRMVSRSKNLIYYNSDPEFDKDYKDGKMILQWILDNPENILSRYFLSRCKLIITGFKTQVKEIQSRYPQIPVVYLPQVINPSIPLIRNKDKDFDAFIINTSPDQKYVADYLTSQGVKLLVLTFNKDWCIEGQSCIEFKHGGLPMDFLLSAVSLCKYYIGSYFWRQDVPWQMMLKYASWSHSSKVLESYYAGTEWISTNKNVDQVVDYILNNRYNPSKYFNYIEQNYSINNYKSEIDKIVQICKEVID